MRWNVPMIVNGVAIAVALGCLLAALRSDRQYGEAHSRATQAIETVHQSGTDFNPKGEDITSPEIYYQRAKSVRQWAVPVWIIALGVAWVTRKRIPAIIVTLILL